MSKYKIGDIVRNKTGLWYRVMDITDNDYLMCQVDQDLGILNDIMYIGFSLWTVKEIIETHYTLINYVHSPLYKVINNT